MNSKYTKTNLVKEHLRKKKNITSMEAYKKYDATRLSAIIYSLRQHGWIIEDEWEVTINKHGIPSRYVRYRLISEEDYIEKNMNHIPRID